MIEGRHLAPGARAMAEFAGLLDRFWAWGTRGQTGLPADFRQRAPEIHGSLVSPRRAIKIHGSLVSPRRAIVSPRTDLGLVRIEVTAGATEIGELVGHGVVQLRLF